jgi:hypothetical protein
MIPLSREAVERSIQLAREKRNWPDERPAVRLMFTALAYHDAAARIEALEQALRDALPILEESYRWHRDAQSHAAIIMRACRAVETARAALAQTGEPK